MHRTGNEACHQRLSCKNSTHLGEYLQLEVSIVQLKKLD